MSNSHEILFVRRTANTTAEPTITHVGGKLKEGVPWSIPIADAINGIQSGRFEFYIMNGDGKAENLTIGRHSSYGMFLKTTHDKGKPERLLRLPSTLG